MPDNTQNVEQSPGGGSLEDVVRPLLLYINRTPELISLLYDMDLLPEQCEHGSRDWRNMLLLTEAWKNRQKWPNDQAHPTAADSDRGRH